MSTVRADRPAPPTADERVARGRAARAEAPRSAHASLPPRPRRFDPVAVLERQARTRVPELVPIRYGRMLSSPFAFYRGGAAIMAADLAGTPRSGMAVQLCGDAHLSNFGMFASPERRLVFDLNDFDETLPGPWEWDVKRLVASIAVAGRENGHSEKERRDAARAVAREYREAMREFAGMRSLDVWYAHLEVDRVTEALRHTATTPSASRRWAATSREARTRDSMRSLAAIGLFLGTRDGQDSAVHGRSRRPRRRCSRSTWAAAPTPTAGRRVVAGQRLMQASGDILLGWYRGADPDGTPRDFHVRQLKDWKGSVTVEALDPEGMEGYGRLCAWTLARAHARSGDRIAIGAYLGAGEAADRALADFAEAYADRNEADYAALQEAVASGRVAARTGV